MNDRGVKGRNERTTADLTARMSEDQKLVDEAIDRWLPTVEDTPALVHEAMRYSTFAGGKRFRPILVLESCRVVGGDLLHALPSAVALELIHTYSLIHDDLPCMDNAELRRGQPTCHIRFGEAHAVLAGDALLTLAFSLLAIEQGKSGVSPGVALEVTGMIAEAAGTPGMVGGQVLDIQHTGAETDISPDRLFEIHARKTGALIRVAVESGAVLGGAGPEEHDALRTYGEKIGLAFQIADDLLDVRGTSAALGKDVAGDAALSKLTFPAVFGVERSAEMAEEACAVAVASLEPFGRAADYLGALAEFVVHRKR